MKNLIFRLGKSIEKFPHRNSICYENQEGIWQKYSYEDLDFKIRYKAIMLQKYGIEKSSKVVLLLENSPDWIFVYFGILFLGAVVVPLDPHSTSEDILNIISDVEPMLVVSQTKFQKSFERIKEKCSFVKGIVFIDQELACPNFKVDGLTPCFVGQDDTVSIMYTSGTTDKPKGVVLSHSNLISNYEAIASLNLFTENDCALAVLPFYHTYSIMVNILNPLFLGGSLVIPNSLREDSIFKAFKNFSISIFPVVPQLMYAFHKSIASSIDRTFVLKKMMLNFALNIFWVIRLVSGVNFTKGLLSPLHKKFGGSFKCFICGGAALDKKVEKDMLVWGFNIMQGYGLTETSPILTLNLSGAKKAGSVGRQIPGVEIKIIKDDLKNKEGEVIAYGPNVMRGYYKKLDATSEVLKQGWFYTGDLGFKDKDGYVYLTGRRKEVIVLSSGKNIYPEEIEKHYLKIPYISQICVVSYKDKDTTLEKLHAFIFPNFPLLKQRGEINITELVGNRIEDISVNLPEYKRINGFSIIKEELPRTSLGKLKRYEVLKRYKDLIYKKGDTGKDDIPVEDVSLSDLDCQILDCLKTTFNLKYRPLLTDSLELDLGVTSLGRIELLDAFQREFSVRFLNSFFDVGIFTVKDLLEKVKDVIEHGESLEGADGMSSMDKSGLWKEMLNNDPPAEILSHIRLKPNLTDKILTWIFIKMVFLVLKIFNNIKVSGINNIPKNKVFMLCSNHQSYVDGFIVSSSTPYFCQINLFFMAFKAYFDSPIMKTLLKKMRIIPIDLAENMIGAMQLSSYVLRNSKILVIFPEGERTSDGEVKRFKKGAGILVKETNVGIVPVYIKGAVNSWPRTARFPKPYPIEVRFGEYVGPEELIRESQSSQEKDQYQAISNIIREKVLMLEKSDSKKGV